MTPSIGAGDAAIERLRSSREDQLATLVEYLEIPSISTDPEYTDDVRRCAEFLRGQFESRGLESKLIETEGHPLVYAEWRADDDRPTILFYGHYDVQPVDPLDLWRNPPFQPTIEGGRLVARGATDDKGQSLTHLLAVGAMLETRGELPVNVKFIVEGEEESGGEAIEKFVREDGGRTLGCDAVVISDTKMYGPGQPSLIYGLKGMLYLQLELRGPATDLHSGMFGGAVSNPLNALGHVLTELQDPRSGRIGIPGFYDDVVPLSDRERAAFAKLPFDEAEYRRELGVSALHGEDGFSTLERSWARPTCDVNGLWGGYQGAGAKTVLPSECGAKISMRLVPDQKPKTVARQFQELLEQTLPPGVEASLEILGEADPVVIDLDGPIVDASLRALEGAWGTEPVLVREGGSIPIVSSFAQELDVPVLLIGFGLADDQLHAPNEKLELENFYRGSETIVHLLDEVAANA